MKQRVRRSSFAMDDDPITLIVALDSDVSCHELLSKKKKICIIYIICISHNITCIVCHQCNHVLILVRVMLWARFLLMMDTRLTTRKESLCIVHSPSLLTHSLERK